MQFRKRLCDIRTWNIFRRQINVCCVIVFFSGDRAEQEKAAVHQGEGEDRTFDKETGIRQVVVKPHYIVVMDYGLTNLCVARWHSGQGIGLAIGWILRVQSQPLNCRVPPWTSHLHIFASATKQYNWYKHKLGSKHAHHMTHLTMVVQFRLVSGCGP